jgi:ribosomal protein L4
MPSSNSSSCRRGKRAGAWPYPVEGTRIGRVRRIVRPEMHDCGRCHGHRRNVHCDHGRR